MHTDNFQLTRRSFSQVRMCVVDRNTGKVVETKYESADTFFFFHHANTYEDKGN